MCQALLVRDVLIYCHDDLKSRCFSGYQESSILKASKSGKTGRLTVVFMKEMA